MKSLTPIISALVLLLGSVSTAFAASGAREDNSGIFVWIFLGFCALIVVMQLMPAVFMMLGIAKGLQKESPQEHKATH